MTIQAPAQSPFGGPAEEAEAGSFAWAGGTEASLRADGFDPSATVLPWPHYADDPRGVMGVRVRVGDFATQTDANADAALARLEAVNPKINAVIVDLAEQARTAIRAGLPEGPFRGVPYLIKDISEADGGVPDAGGLCGLLKDIAPAAADSASLSPPIAGAGRVCSARPTRPSSACSR